MGLTSGTTLKQANGKFIRMSLSLETGSTQTVSTIQTTPTIFQLKQDVITCTSLSLALGPTVLDFYQTKAVRRNYQY